jgi:diadenosine tetraphosphatase ApaH/serine/threonine PP2A family protein phosphatase
MRVAILSDVHANAEALRAVLDDIDRRGVRSIACLGDSVGYGAEPAECLDLLFQSCSSIIAGNHDLAATGRLADSRFSIFARNAVNFARRLLTPAQRDRLAKLQDEEQLGELLLVHASPSDHEEFPYIRDVELARASFEARPFGIACYGHTHVPLVFAMSGGRVSMTMCPRVELVRGARYLINVGSVGQPRDQDPRAAYAIFDSDQRVLSFHRVAYDTEKASAKIRAAGLPEQLGARLLVGV